MRLFYTLTLFASILLIASSCNKLDNKSISKSNKLIVGTWTIKKVKNSVNQDGTWGKNDVSNNFEGWTFEFRPDNTARLTIPNENLSVEGGWELYETYNSDEDETTSMNLYMYFDHPDNWDEYREFTWLEMTVNKNTFKALEVRHFTDYKVNYYYELSR